MKIKSPRNRQILILLKDLKSISSVLTFKFRAATNSIGTKILEHLYILICSTTRLERVQLAEMIYGKNLQLHEIVFIVSQNMQVKKNVLE